MAQALERIEALEELDLLVVTDSLPPPAKVRRCQSQNQSQNQSQS